MQYVAYSPADAAYADETISYRMADYRPERRRHRRRRLNLTAAANRLDNTLLAQRQPRFVMTVIDVSEGGVFATSAMPVGEGERLSVEMPPESKLPRLIFGRVSRCEAGRQGWSLAIAFDAIPAA